MSTDERGFRQLQRKKRHTFDTFVSRLSPLAQCRQIGTDEHGFRQRQRQRQKRHRSRRIKAGSGQDQRRKPRPEGSQTKAGAVVSYSERGAKDNPWIESFWGHFKGENASLLIEAATLDELEQVIDQQMIYYNRRRRHSSLDYLAPVEYLEREGMHLEPLAHTTLSTGSATGAQVPVYYQREVFR